MQDYRGKRMDFLNSTKKKAPLFSSPTREHLYNQNLDLMNKFLVFKDHELHNLETEISVKDKIYKQLFDSAPDAFIISTNDTISFSNQALLKLLDAKDDTDVIGEKIWKFIHPDSIGVARPIYNNLFKGIQDIIVVDLQILSLSNTPKEVRVSSSITSFENVSYIVSCFHDLTNHNEQERIQLQLEKNIADEKFKVEFFANISHDLKTPLNLIYSAVQLQDMYALSNDFDKVLVYNSVIKQNCLRLQKLLNDVLDLTKIDADHFKPNLEPCNIICSIEYITQSIASYLEDKNITIVFDTNVEDKFTMTDSNLIERIMLNLVSNAIKYGKQDGNV